MATGGRTARVLLALALVLPAGCASQTDSDASPVASRLRDPDELARGKRLFLGACAGYCHAARAGGGGEAPNLFDCEWLHGGSDAEVFATISRGVPDTQMEGFGSRLPDEDIWTLVAYLRSTSVCEQPGGRAASERGSGASGASGAARSEP